MEHVYSTYHVYAHQDKLAARVDKQGSQRMVFLLIVLSINVIHDLSLLRQPS